VLPAGSFASPQRGAPVFALLRFALCVPSSWQKYQNKKIEDQTFLFNFNPPGGSDSDGAHPADSAPGPSGCPRYRETPDSNALPFFPPSFFHTISLSPAFTSA
jgi:hypothetical protein